MKIDNSTLENMIEHAQWDTLSKNLQAGPVADVADVVAELSDAQVALVARHLPPTLFAGLFSYFDQDKQRSVANELSKGELVQLIGGLRPDDRINFLETLPEETAEEIFPLLNKEDRRNAKRLLGYPEESVGRFMTSEFIAVSSSWNLAQALAYIQENGQQLETINTIYVTDEEGRLLDVLELERFVLGNPSDPVSKIMDDSFVSLLPDEDREEAVRLIQKHDVYAIPVIDANHTLLGVITADDVMDIAEQETTEDIQKGGGISPLEDSYHHSSIWELYRKRVLWLMILVFVNLAASGVIALHESTLASSIGLLFFIPLLMGAGGNTGAQSATLIVRALATGDLQYSQWAHIMTKEMLVGGSLGLTLGLGIGWLGILREDWSLGFTVALAMLAVVVVSNLLGVLFPLLLTKLRFDPAVASSPLVTSTADITTLWLYFSVALVVLQ
ncbi:MAG: magnesium transporter [Nitrospirales bacterium]|nr:magnesium transporter [Nitrospirales bacterium]